MALRLHFTVERLAAALIAPVAFCAVSPALGATGSAQSKAVIVGRLSLLAVAALDFGSLASGTAGSCTIDADTGTRTVTGGVALLGGGSGPAQFVGAGTPNKTVLIREPRSTITLTRSGGTETMTVSNFTVSGGNGTSRKIPANGVLIFNVGGRLNVGANQAGGNYVGSFTVTVDYN